LSAEGQGGRWGVALLFVLPLCFFAAEWLLRQNALPYWSWFSLDPSYSYLMGGMSILEGVSPTYSDHPGTPVETVMAALIWLTGRGSPGSVSDAAFLQAESLLTLANTVMTALDAGALLLLGWTVRRRFGHLVPALLAQTTPFLTMLALKHGIEVEPEPMLLLAVLLLGVAMLEEMTMPRVSSLAALAAVIGFGTACKITFAPLVLAPLIMIAGWRSRLALVLGAGVALGIFLLPAIGNFGPMLRWFLHLAMGSGTYGTGAQTIIALDRYPAAFVKLFFPRPIFLGVFVLSAAALTWRLIERRRLVHPASPAERALLGILVAQLVQILLAAKQPTAHYVLPALELSGLAMVFLWKVVREMVTDLREPLPARLFAALLGILIIGQGSAFFRQYREISRESSGAQSIDLTRDFPRCAHVYQDLASAPSQAWFYNETYGEPRYAKRVAKLLPGDDYFYLSWRGYLENGEGRVDPAKLAARYPCLALRGINPDALNKLALSFGRVFAKSQTCTAGTERILLAGASCPQG
jgi:hypothetical protein